MSGPRVFHYPTSNATYIANEQVPVVGVPLILNNLNAPGQNPMIQPFNTPLSSSVMYDMAREIIIASPHPGDITYSIIGKNQYGTDVAINILYAGPETAAITGIFFSSITSITPISITNGPATLPTSVGIDANGQTRFWQMDSWRPGWYSSIEVFLPTPAVNWTYGIYTTNAQICTASTSRPGQVEVRDEFFSRTVLAGQTTSTWTALPDPFTTIWVQVTVDGEESPDIPCDLTAFIIQQGVRT